MNFVDGGVNNYTSVSAALTGLDADGVINRQDFIGLDDLQTFIKGDEYQNQIKPLREGTGEYHIAFYEAPPSA